MAQKVQNLVLHCLATPYGTDIKGSDVIRWHTAPKPEGNGWKVPGYTDIIHMNGGVERLVQNNDDGIVDPWEVTNGAAGYNGISRHIAYVGGLDENGKAKDTRTEGQHKTLKSYVFDFLRTNPDAKVVGHYQLNPGKECPCFDVPRWLTFIGVPAKNITA
jgi:hypothetical protein